MSIAKTIEVSSQSTAGFSEAAQAAITEVSRTVNNVKHVWVESFEMVVQDDGSFIYRTHCKVTFVVGPDGAG
ncbi:MAG: dodecin domain-containing protein [Bacteroidetes bacterium]|nr:dodecin domain-containing protein [Bacteroidota bacterium]MCH8031946.1 dodecin domain-containing protein [Bacteroidota bacterium]